MFFGDDEDGFTIDGIGNGLVLPGGRADHFFGLSLHGCQPVFAFLPVIAVQAAIGDDDGFAAIS